MRKDFRKQQDFYYQNKSKNTVSDPLPIKAPMIEEPQKLKDLNILTSTFSAETLTQKYYIGSRQAGKAPIYESTLDQKEFDEWFRERMRKLREEFEEEERLYGESTRVPEKWGEDLWIATLEGEDTDLPQHSYTIKELRNAVQNWVRDLWDYDENEFFEEYPDISWDMEELQELYRKMYRFIHTTDNLGKDVDIDPWYEDY